jgi:hypothetical protein
MAARFRCWIEHRYDETNCDVGAGFDTPFLALTGFLDYRKRISEEEIQDTIYVVDINGPGVSYHKFITDGFGSWWNARCPDCGNEMQIMRPGDCRCVNCYDGVE